MMLNVAKFRFCFAGRGRFRLSTFAVRELRGDYMYVLEDRNQDLQYMREVETPEGKRGIVLKIADTASTYLAMYEPVPRVSQTTLTLARTNIAWQTTFNDLLANIQQKPSALVDVNGRTLLTGTAVSRLSEENSERRLLSSSPLLDICYDLTYGDMFQFTGCLGSRKTTTLTSILRHLGTQPKGVGLYYNPVFSETERAVRESGCWGFSSGKTEQTDAGVYMLTLKTVRLAAALAKQGFEVGLGLDNFKSVLHAEWHMLQLLSSNFGQRRGEAINNSAPKLAPISILNEVYSSCNDHAKGKKPAKGSFTAMVVTENNNKDELMPEITPFSNNLKHLNSLAMSVTFPLAAKQSPNAHKLNRQDQELTPRLYLRNQINAYLQEKQDTELRRRLYKSDLTDAPWDYYAILDADWWLKGLTEAKISNFKQLESLLQWTAFNIELELVSHWKVTSLEALAHYRRFLGERESSRASMEQFIEWARGQGWFSPFKKDYLN